MAHESTSSAAKGHDAVRPVPEHIPLRVWALCAILAIGGFVSMLTATVINVALPTIGREFGASLGATQWIVTVFLLGLAATIPLSGWAAQKLGVTRLWLISMAVFTVLSIVCALASSLEVLVCARLALGLAGGLLVPASQMMLGIIAGPQRMGRVMSVLGVPIVLAPALGVTIGSLLLSTFGVASLFWINVPLGLLGVAIGYKWLPRIEGKDAGRFDLVGFLLLAAGIPLFTWGISEFDHAGNQSVNPLSPYLGAATGMALLLIFVFHALRVKAPFLKVILFSRPVFTYASLIVFSAGFITFGAQMILPLYYLQVRGDSVETAGLMVLPQAIGIALALPLGGWLTDHFGGGRIVILGIILTILGTTALALAGPAETDMWLATVLVLRGFGLSMLSMPAYTAALAILERTDVPNAIPIMNVLNRIGGAVGTALLIVVFQFGGLDPSSDVQAALNGFGLAHWAMVGLLLLTLLPAYTLARAERLNRNQQSR